MKLKAVLTIAAIYQAIIGLRMMFVPGRNLEPSPALNAIVLANIVVFGCVALSDVWSVFSGGSRPIAKVFLVIHVLLAVGFVVAWQTRLRQREHRSAL